MSIEPSCALTFDQTPSNEDKLPLIVKNQATKGPKSQIYKEIITASAQITISLTISGLTFSFFLVLLNNQSSETQAAISLSLSYLNIVGSAIFAAMNSGLMNRLSHVYGAKNYKLMGLYIHRGIIINVIAVIVCSFVIHFTPGLLEYIGYDAGFVENITNFMSIAIFSVPFVAIWQLYSNFLTSIENFSTGSFIQVISCLSSVFISYILVEKYSLALEGIAFAYVYQQFSSALLIFIYCYCVNPVREMLFKFQKESFEGIWELTKYIFKAGGQQFIDWVGYEIMILLSGTLDPKESDAFVLSLSLNFLCLTTGFAISIAGSSFVGNYMGAMEVKKAKEYAKASSWISIVYGGIVLVVALIFIKPITSIFTDNQEVAGYMEHYMIFILASMPVDNFQNVIGGTVRAIKLENKAFIVTTVNMYAISLPLTIVLVYETGLGVYGIIIGAIIMMVLSAIAYVYLVLKADWNKQAELISQTLESESFESLAKISESD